MNSTFHFLLFLAIVWVCCISGTSSTTTVGPSCNDQLNACFQEYDRSPKDRTTDMIYLDCVQEANCRWDLEGSRKQRTITDTMESMLQLAKKEETYEYDNGKRYNSGHHATHTLVTLVSCLVISCIVLPAWSMGLCLFTVPS